MAYERVDPAQWWRDAQAMPPAPDGPGEWVTTAYGWAWREAEIESDAPTTVRATGGIGVVLPPLPGVDIRVIAGETPRDPAPDSDDDTAGYLREGMRALDRIAARAEAEAKASGGGGATGPNVAPAAGQPLRIYASDGTLLGVAWPGCTSFVVGTHPLRAPAAVPDPPPEAERRAVEAAREWCASVEAAWASLDIKNREIRAHLNRESRALMDAVAALDGDGG